MLHRLSATASDIKQEGRITTTPHSRDLETVLYQNFLLEKQRSAHRNLRYAVFSDTELLTGKFTITSTDDSAIDSGEDDLPSSRGSLNEVHLHGNSFDFDERAAVPNAQSSPSAITAPAANKPISLAYSHTLKVSLLRRSFQTHV